MYLEGISAREIARKLGLEGTAGYRSLKRLGISRRNSSHAAQKYELNEQYFKVIDTPDKAYWLGFIASDGNVCKGTFQCDLKISDRAHLEKMRQSFGSTHIIFDRFNKTRKVWQSRFAFKNVEFIINLQRVGIHEKKSQTVKSWSGPQELIHHYWRGVIDGDGSIYKDNKNRWNLTLNGSEEMCHSFLDFVKTLTTTTASVRKGHGNIFEAKFCGINLVQDIVRALYPENCLSLERKAILSKEALSVVPTFKRRVKQ